MNYPSTNSIRFFRFSAWAVAAILLWMTHCGGADTGPALGRFMSKKPCFLCGVEYWQYDRKKAEADPSRSEVESDAYQAFNQKADGFYPLMPPLFKCPSCGLAVDFISDIILDLITAAASSDPSYPPAANMRYLLEMEGVKDHLLSAPPYYIAAKINYQIFHLNLEPQYLAYNARLYLAASWEAEGRGGPIQSAYPPNRTYARLCVENYLAQTDKALELSESWTGDTDEDLSWEMKVAALYNLVNLHRRQGNFDTAALFAEQYREFRAALEHDTVDFPNGRATLDDVDALMAKQLELIQGSDSDTVLLVGHILTYTPKQYDS